MKDALQLCSLALNPSAPSPTATMVKIEDRHMVSFGGTFCVRVPVSVEVGACFNPGAVMPFFRKARKKVAYTLKGKRLWIQEGSEKLSVPFLPPEEMVTLDVLEPTQPVSFDLAKIKILTEIVNPTHHMICGQGVMFFGGMAEALNSAVGACLVTDLPDEFCFNLPLDSAKALLRFKPKLTAMAQSQQAIKFVFEDGSSLTSRLISEHLIDTSRVYSGEWAPIKLKDPEDLAKIDCDFIRFESGNVHYTKDDSEGILEGRMDKKISCRIKKETLDTLLKVSADLRLSDDNGRLMALTKECRAVGSVLRS